MVWPSGDLLDKMDGPLMTLCVSLARQQSEVQAALESIAATRQAERDRHAEEQRAVVARATQSLNARVAELAQELEAAHKKTEAAGAAVTAVEAKLASKRQANQSFRQVLLEHEASTGLNSAASTSDLLGAVLAKSVTQTEQHQQCVASVAELRRRVQQLSSELQNSQAQAGSAGTTNQDLQSQLQTAQQAAAAAALQHLSQTETVNGLERQLRRSQRTARASKRDFEAADDELKDVYARLANRTQQRDTLMKDVQSQWDQLQRSKSIRSNKQQQLTDAEQQQQSELAQKLSAAEQQLTKSEHRRAELDQMLQDENQNDSGLQQHVAELTAELQSTTQALQASQQQATNLHRQIQSQHNAHTQQLKTLQQQLNECTAELHQSAQTAAESKTAQTQVGQRECRVHLTDDVANIGETEPSLQADSLQQSASQLHAHLAAAQQALAAQADAIAPAGQNDCLQQKLAAAQQLIDPTSGNPHMSTTLSTAYDDSVAAAAVPMADGPSRAFQQQIGDMQTAPDRAGEASEPMIETTKAEQPQHSALATGSGLPRSRLTESSSEDLGSVRHEPSSYAAVTNQAGSSVPDEDQSGPGSSEEHKESDAPASMQEGCQQEGHLASHSMAEVPQAPAQTAQGQAKKVTLPKAGKRKAGDGASASSGTEVLKKPRHHYQLRSS